MTSRPRSPASPSLPLPQPSPSRRRGPIYAKPNSSVKLPKRKARRLARRLYPQVSLNGVFEADRGRFVTQAGANWFAGVTMRWNLFNGGADRRRIDEASHQTAAARAGERQASQAAQLELRQAEASFAAANERIGVAEAAVEHARESLRIVKNRFGAGLTTVQELLRNETALVDAEMRRLRARYDQRIAAVMTELAAGTLTEGSDVLR